MKLIAAVLALVFAATGQPPNRPKPTLDQYGPLAWVDPNRAEPEGTHYRTFHSKTINADVSYLVYLPPDYEQQQTVRYPVLYFLHGSGGTPRGSANVAKRLDTAIRASRVSPMILILVNGLAGNTMYCDTPDGKYPVETVIMKDLIPHVDSTYRTVASRESRAIDGFSVGGYGAALLGFKYPEMFGVISISAPALLGPAVQGNAPAGAWAKLFPTAMGGDMAYFEANNPFTLAVKNAGALRDRTLIRIATHSTPGNWQSNRCEELHKLLVEHMIPHEFYFLTSVKTHNRVLVMDTIGDAEFAFFSSTLPLATPGRGPPVAERQAKPPVPPRQARPALPANYGSYDWVDPDRVPLEGTLYKTFHSKTINGDVSYLVYLPPNYEQSSERYPVLYDLPASGGTPKRDGASVVRRVSAAIGAGRISPMIVVLVNGLRGNTMYCDSRDGKYPLETVIVKDLVPHVDGAYRTIASRDGRAVDGFSMGGFGAAHLGFKYPETFGVISIMAPPLLGPELKQHLPAQAWSRLFPLAMNNDLEYFRANDPFTLAEKNADALRDRTVIRIVAHWENEQWLYPQCENLHQALVKNLVQHEFYFLTNVKGHNREQCLNTMGDAAFDFFSSSLVHK